MAFYTPTIGLEIHAELKTVTKMFCASRNDPDCPEPNFNVCPVCMGHPGTLPVINKQAVKHVLMVGLALGGKLADYTEFDRKNYFYPDLPKGYQISQYEFPLVKGGFLAGVEITRVHLEEDTARSQHGPRDEVLPGRGHEYSLLDFNRSGVPLMELVTEPVVDSADKAAAFARELQLLLRYLGVSSANMEKGEMRVEANISLSEKQEGGSGKLGTKVEVKNLNSIRAVKQAIFYEIERQTKLLESRESVVQETRGWDESRQTTFSQRLKEESHDYRYFPEPDLPKLVISKIPEFNESRLRAEMPELPSAKRERYIGTFVLRDDIADTLVSNIFLGRFFDSVCELAHEDKVIIGRAANYISADLAGLIGQSGDGLAVLGRLSAEDFVELMRMSLDGRLSSRGTKDILKAMADKGGSPTELAKAMNLEQVSDQGDLEKIIRQITEENPKAVADYRSGRQSSLQFLVGQAMKVSRGAANPEVLRTMFVELLGRLETSFSERD